jgi:hypothetical protein
VPVGGDGGDALLLSYSPNSVEAGFSEVRHMQTSTRPYER